VSRALAILFAVSLAPAQAPVVGSIDLFGLRNIAPEWVLDAAKVRTGAALPPSKGALEDAIEQVPGVVAASVEAVCCEGPGALLFIGIEEKGAPHFALREAPSGSAALPADLVEDYGRFAAAVERTAQEGTSGPKAVRDLERRFASFAAANLPLLRDVLRTGAEPDERAIAAAVLGYAKDQAAAAADLQYAITDPVPAVRANAMRSLAGIAAEAQRKPAIGVRIAPTWLVEALHSVTLSDRTEAVNALTVLTDRPNPTALELMRTRALPDLVEMARWNSLRHALPPFVLVGRIAGFSDERIQKLWEAGDREPVIRKAQSPPARKR
jgi:hypothetical protein